MELKHYIKENFKQRLETNFIYLKALGTVPMSFEEFYNKSWQHGSLGTGYHYFIDSDGLIHEDRPEGAVADCDFENYESSVYICIEAEDMYSLNAVQKVIVNKLCEDLLRSYPNAQVIY